MFGKFRRTPATPKVSIPGHGDRQHVGMRPNFGFDMSKVTARTMATYDRLGQTLVATPVVATLSGPDAGMLGTELCQQIEAAQNDPNIPGGVRHVVLDLQNVQYMDSMCIGVLVELLTMLKEGGGRIALVNAATNVEYLFKLTRLDRVFPICRDVMKAIDAVERQG